MMLALQSQSAARTMAGFRDAVVSDALLAREDLQLWAVADGVGASSEARWAATTMIGAFATAAENGGDEPQLPFDGAIDDGHRIISGTSMRLGESFATAFAGIAMRYGKLSGAWIGNCRVYRLRNNRFERLTRDHSIAGELAAQGEISDYEVSGHPFAKILTRAVGSSKNPQAEHFECEVLPGDRYLLCSSGLPRALPDPLIALYLDRGSPKTAADRLIGEAIACGAGESVSAIVIDAAS